MITISGACLVPAASLADGAPDPPPIGAACQLGGGGAGVIVEGGDCEPAPEAPQEPAPEQSPAGAEEPQEPASPAQAPAPESAAGDASPSPESPSGLSTGTDSASPGPASPPAAKRRADTAPRPPATLDATDTPTAERRTSSAKGPRGGARGQRRTARDRAKTAAELIEDAALPGLSALPTAAGFFVSDEPVIPGFLMALYKEAGRRYGIPWAILAAINEIESDFGRNVAVSPAGARGWMQFMPGTWRAYGVDADRDGAKDPNSPRDAIFAAARYLRAHGAPGDMRGALFAYNHAGWYVDAVLLRAERIAGHHGERSRALERLLDSSGPRLVREVLGDERIELYECGRRDVAAGRIDRRVLAVLRFLASAGLHPTVTSLECGHGIYTSAGHVSAHAYGAAVDITAINGIAILGHQGPGSVTDATIRELLTLRGSLAPAQIISLMAYDGADSTIAMGDHADHIHVGFRPLRDLGR